MDKGDQENNADSLHDWEYPDERDTTGDTDSIDLTVCPYCNKAMAEAAEVCPHCRNYISREEPRKPIRWWIWIIEILLLVAMLILAIFR